MNSVGNPLVKWRQNTKLGSSTSTPYYNGWHMKLAEINIQAKAGMSIIVKGFPHKLSNFFKEQIRKQEMKEEDVSPKRKWCISGFLFLQSKIICVCVLVNGWYLSSISKSLDSYPIEVHTSILTDCFQQLHNFFFGRRIYFLLFCVCFQMHKLKKILAA